MLDWPKFLLKAGFVMFALLLVLQVLTFHVLCVMSKEVPWKGLTFILIRISGNKQILGFTSIQKNVHTTNRNSNTFILKEFCLKIKKSRTMRRKKNFITITLINLLILKISPVAITFGFIMSVQFGFLNAIFSKKWSYQRKRNRKYWKKTIQTLMFCMQKI